MPAVTTPFDERDEVDLPRFGAHARWLVENGCSTLILFGSVGEGGTLAETEKRDMLRTLREMPNLRAQVVTSVGALATRDAVRLAREFATLGSQGLMILPPYAYHGDPREVRAHFSAILGATELPCMIYNNPIAYGTDLVPEEILDLATEHTNLAAVKESSGDVRRITSLRALLGRRLELVVGIDDLLLEGIGAGATAWVGGLANALPRESVELLIHALPSKDGRGAELYRWLLPLLRLDSDAKFVQLIKAVVSLVGWGPARLRLPRLAIEGNELERVRATLERVLRDWPANVPASTPIPTAVPKN
ncbi:MAG: dihydrodipicolinate synthase family protein [Thermoplasmata archaeon]